MLIYAFYKTWERENVFVLIFVVFLGWYNTDDFEWLTSDTTSEGFDSIWQDLKFIFLGCLLFSFLEQFQVCNSYKTYE